MNDVPRPPHHIEPRNGARIEPQIRARPGSSVPFVIGNLGASAIIDVAKGLVPAAQRLFADLPRLASLGIDAVEDYVGWNVVEPREGTPDFSLHVAHRDEAKRLGIAYVVYPWVHALPAWITDERRFEPFRCVEHGLPTIHPSIFAPSTLALHDRFYRLLARGLGGDLEALTLAVPCDYGEVGYPTGMGAWVLNAENDAVHRHEGFWCGDEHAVRHFRERMLARFGSLDAVNAIFDTAFRRSDDLRPLAPPDLDSFSDRFRFEQIEWYRGALLDFVRAIAGIARRHFPRAKLGLKCGYAGERACFGQDYSRLVPLARELGATIWSTHGTLPTVFHKRIRTLCRVHEVPYFTESPTERTREQVRDRLFEDAADGAEGFFEFHDTFLEFEGDFLAHRPLLRGELPDVDLAVLFHSTAQVLEPGRSLPPNLVALGEPLRELADYEVVDEETIAAAGAHAALSRYSVLLVPDPGPAFAPAVAAIVDFAERGGLVVLPAAPRLMPIAGERLAEVLAAPTPCEAPLPRDHWRIECGQDSVLRFGDGSDEWRLFGAFEGPEFAKPYVLEPRHEHARWTGARAGFRMPRPLRDGAFLTITLHADHRTLARPIEVSCDGVAIDSIREPGTRTLRYAVAPRSAAGRATFEIEFDCEPFRPAHSGSADRRALGVLLHYAAIEESTASDAATSTDSEAASSTAPAMTPIVDPAALVEHRFRRIGSGGAIFAPPRDLLALVGCALAALDHRAVFTDAGFQGAATGNARREFAPGVRVARFHDRRLVYRRGSAPANDGGTPIVPRLQPGEIREIPESR